MTEMFNVQKKCDMALLNKDTTLKEHIKTE